MAGRSRGCCANVVAGAAVWSTVRARRSSRGTVEHSRGGCISEAAGNTGGGWETRDSGHSPRGPGCRRRGGQRGQERKNWAPRLGCSRGHGPLPGAPASPGNRQPWGSHFSWAVPRSSLCSPFKAQCPHGAWEASPPAPDVVTVFWQSPGFRGLAGTPPTGSLPPSRGPP